MENKFIVQMWKIFFVLSASSILGTFLCANKLKADREIISRGKIVSVRVTQKDSYVLSRPRHYFKFLYESKEYIANLNTKYADSFDVGSQIRLVHIDETRFLFPDDDLRGDKVGFVLLSLISLILVSMCIKTFYEDMKT